jgi:hypothetical protein
MRWDFEQARDGHTIRASDKANRSIGLLDIASLPLYSSGR